MVADDGATKLQVGAHERMLAIIPKAYLGIVVFEVRAIDTCSNVSPLPYYGIYRIAIVCLIGISENH